MTVDGDICRGFLSATGVDCHCDVYYFNCKLQGTLSFACQICWFITKYLKMYDLPISLSCTLCLLFVLAF